MFWSYKQSVFNICGKTQVATREWILLETFTLDPLLISRCSPN